MQDGDIQTCAGYRWRLLDTFIFRQKMSSSQRGITLWEHSKPADLQNNAVLIHAFVTSLNMKQHQTFQRSHHGRFSERDQWVQNLFYTASRTTSGVLCFKTIETVDSIRSSCLTWKKETQSEQTVLREVTTMTTTFEESWHILLKGQDPTSSYED